MQNHDTKHSPTKWHLFKERKQTKPIISAVTYHHLQTKTAYYIPKTVIQNQPPSSSANSNKWVTTRRHRNVKRQNVYATQIAGVAEEELDDHFAWAGGSTTAISDTHIDTTAIRCYVTRWGFPPLEGVERRRRRRRRKKFPSQVLGLVSRRGSRRDINKYLEIGKTNLGRSNRSPVKIRKGGL